MYDCLVLCSKSGLDEELVACVTHKHKYCLDKHKNCRYMFPRPPMRKSQIIFPIGCTDCSEEKLQAIKNDWKHIQITMKSIDKDSNLSYMEFLELVGFTEERYLLAVRAGVWRPIVLFKREPADMYVNNYLRHALPLWRANMDAQPVLDAYAVVEYIAAYMCKGNQSLTEVMEKTVRAGLSGNVPIQQMVS